MPWQSLRVQMSVSTALNLVAQKKMRDVIVVTALQPDPSEIPQTWANLKGFDASIDYPRAIARVRLELGLDELDNNAVTQSNTVAVSFVEQSIDRVTSRDDDRPLGLPPLSSPMGKGVYTQDTPQSLPPNYQKSNRSHRLWFTVATVIIVLIFIVVSAGLIYALNRKSATPTALIAQTSAAHTVVATAIPTFTKLQEGTTVPTPHSTSNPSPQTTPTPLVTPSLAPTATSVPLNLLVNPVSFFANSYCGWQGDEMNGQHGGGIWSCAATLQNPAGTQKTLSWSASSSGITSSNSAVSFSQTSGSLVPGQSTTVNFKVSVYFGGSCSGVPQGDIIFRGPLNTVNAPWKCANTSYSITPLNLNAQTNCQLSSGQWQCMVTATQSLQGQVIFSASSSNGNINFQPSLVMMKFAKQSRANQYLLTNDILSWHI